MRLPIYRRLDEKLKIFGLSLRELALLGFVFVGFGQLLSFWKWGRPLALLLTLIAFFVIVVLNRRMEAFYVEKLLRSLMLPKGLGKHLFSLRGRKDASHA